MSIEIEKMNASMNEARADVKRARAELERILADPDAPPSEKYDAAAMMDEVAENELRIEELDREVRAAK